jgi:LmbE family N-acetylglucosaminyl deacetylase
VALTVVSFHAHPDDESLLTGGTLAGLAAEGHRVVLVTATAGESGVSGSGERGAALASRRLAELDRAASELGIARVVCLGFRDSGYPGVPPVDAFSRIDVGAAAERLATVLTEEAADILTIYDRQGGYGHPDHIQVHHVGTAAAQLADTPRVLQATIDRDSATRLARVLQIVPGLPHEFRPRRLATAYSPRTALTHCIDVRHQLHRKRAAMSAHESQRGGGGRPRSLDIYLRLPRPVFARLFGREWFVEAGRPPHEHLLDGIGSDA